MNLMGYSIGFTLSEKAVPPRDTQPLMLSVTKLIFSLRGLGRRISLITKGYNVFNHKKSCWKNRQHSITY